jgi:hypothetical protein
MTFSSARLRASSGQDAGTWGSRELEQEGDGEGGRHVRGQAGAGRGRPRRSARPAWPRRPGPSPAAAVDAPPAAWGGGASAHVNGDVTRRDGGEHRGARRRGRLGRAPARRLRLLRAGGSDRGGGRAARRGRARARGGGRGGETHGGRRRLRGGGAAGRGGAGRGGAGAGRGGARSRGAAARSQARVGPPAASCSLHAAQDAALAPGAGGGR